MNQKTKSRGFSLVEVLISSSLILLLIIGTAQLLATSLAAKRRGDFHFRAARFASSKWEYLKSLAPQSADLADGHHEDFVREEFPAETLRLEWEVESPDETIKKIRLTVSHPAHPGWQIVFPLIRSGALGF